MQFTQESKSQLAKLMATENLRVEHANVQTAMFNLKTRTLTLPIWKDMSGELYDLLTGHEVGHALETPEEGWHNAVVGSGKYKGVPTATITGPAYVNFVAFQLGSNYYLSKRTNLYAIYGQQQSTSGSLGMAGSGSTANQYAVGMRHTF
jgi:hypothetical protein